MDSRLAAGAVNDAAALVGRAGLARRRPRKQPSSSRDVERPKMIPVAFN
jgi:hypothetical protein